MATTTGTNPILQKISEEEKFSTRRSLIILLVVFLASLALIFYLYMMFPELDESEKQFIKIPWCIEDAKNLANVLDRYKDKYYLEVMFGVFTVYIFLQTFAIPGSMFLSILSGFLFPFAIAIFLVCTCSAIGATLCYTLSQLVGRRIVKHFWPNRVAEWSQHVDKHRKNLLSYILFLRMTPFLPNWFINLSAPLIGVPLTPFAIGTFLGVAPPSIIAIQAGKTLHTMTSSNDAFSWYSILLLSVCACLSLVPVLLRDCFKNKIS